MSALAQGKTRLLAQRPARRAAEPWRSGGRSESGARGFGKRKEVRMSLQPVRLIHSGDWHLETPLGGVPAVPPELREPFLDAPYLAAERVVQAALDHRVDFLLLAGNVLPLDRACPYSFEFLLRQFQRLAEQGIHVYWLGAESDDVDLWPAPLSLPDNVHRFPVGRLHQFEHRARRQGRGEAVGAESSGSGEVGVRATLRAAAIPCLGLPWPVAKRTSGRWRTRVSTTGRWAARVVITS